MEDCADLRDVDIMEHLCPHISSLSSLRLHYCFGFSKRAMDALTVEAEGGGERPGSCSNIDMNWMRTQTQTQLLTERRGR